MFQYSIVEKGKDYEKFLKNWMGDVVNMRDGFYVVTSPVGNIVARVGDVIVKDSLRFRVYTKENFSKKYSNTIEICSVTGQPCFSKEHCSSKCKTYLT